MNKKEIYEQVVRLTAELAQTKVAERIFVAAASGDAAKVDMILDAFPEFYPNLHERIKAFGFQFNAIVGNSEEDNAKFDNILQDCEALMYNLAETKIMSRIADAEKSGDAQEVLGVIRDFKEQYSYFTGELLKFQKKYTEYRDSLPTGHEGAIFGAKADEENGVFVFDTNVIDALSFYLLTIMANTSDVYFFYVEEAREDDEIHYTPANDMFLDAIEDATDSVFATFVSNYNIVDWVGEDKDCQSIGEILVAAFADEFE